MSLPGFSANASLQRAKGHSFADMLDSTTSGAGQVIPAFDLCDWFPWLWWCPKPRPDVYCWHTTTDTYCTGFVMWCKDNSQCSDGSRRSSGWYPCGGCFGWG